MFSYIKGTLASKMPTQVVIEAGSIGYEIMVPLSTFDSLPMEGESVILLTHFHVREDVQQLFGFITRSERDLFRLLISVSGIGPRMALTILSGITTVSFKKAITQADTHLLTSISGVGRKIAERIVLELREKVGFEASEDRIGETGAQEEIILGDAVSALVSLGYKHQSARKAIQKTLPRVTGEVSVEELVREALKIV
jgi:holliday junction DNA helicase RuvA